MEDLKLPISKATRAPSGPLTVPKARAPTTKHRNHGKQRAPVKRLAMRRSTDPVQNSTASRPTVEARKLERVLRPQRRIASINQLARRCPSWAELRGQQEPLAEPSPKVPATIPSSNPYFSPTSPELQELLAHTSFNVAHMRPHLL